MFTREKLWIPELSETFIFSCICLCKQAVDRHDCESLSRVKTAVFSIDFYTDARQGSFSNKDPGQMASFWIMKYVFFFQTAEQLPDTPFEWATQAARDKERLDRQTLLVYAKPESFWMMMNNKKTFYS